MRRPVQQRKLMVIPDPETWRFRPVKTEIRKKAKLARMDAGTELRLLACLSCLQSLAAFASFSPPVAGAYTQEREDLESERRVNLQ